MYSRVFAAEPLLRSRPKCLEKYGYCGKIAIAPCLRRAECQSGSDRVKIWGTTHLRIASARQAAPVPPRFVTNQGEEVGFGELGSAAVELASTLVALIT